MENWANSNARLYELIPQLGRLRDDVLFGDVWEQPELSKRDRSLVTCAILAAMGRNEELVAHVHRGVDNGLTADDLRGLVVQLAFYSGWPSAVNAAKAALPVLDAKD